MFHASLTNSRMQGDFRQTFWNEVYETVLAWYIARPTTVALFNPKIGKFNVTAKGGLMDREPVRLGYRAALPGARAAEYSGPGFRVLAPVLRARPTRSAPRW